MKYASVCSGVEAASLAWQTCRGLPRWAEIQGLREQHGSQCHAVDRNTDSGSRGQPQKGQSHKYRLHNRGRSDIIKGAK